MRIGETIKVRRRAVKLTQEELAEKLNVTPQAVSRWENEVSLPDITLVPRICDELNISIDQLMKDFESRQADYLETKSVAEPLTQKKIDAIFGFVRGQEKEEHHTVLHADDAEFLRKYNNIYLPYMHFTDVIAYAYRILSPDLLCFR